ncbi:hypothetical protein I305_00877 [Cryptococcus gattii E566]|uniref:Uncharacterized protein n=2 Tax=Cryptococcus gattii TaxID=37769 RepID=E6R3M4_CRYGW|nr:Hypothetical Protein CGB_C5460W [Cryptococcus gattii WM276]ADV21075.1 Hypothetical Protein CGB_C5460W [Cryptococcus gattii WM276]KIR82041.1 hypothetical protein I306_00912 [Cryptococcus gattii EJB2]KIY36828.1 hypothetical protein I305_00877 [Cryptococcus gattii E566]KJE04052.1 hypothetical protein I311_02183 [Cryptococcus gattii NT-10]
MLPSERLYLFRRQQRLAILKAAVHATVHTVQAFVESQKQFYCKTALHNNSSIGQYLVDFWLSHSHNEVTRPELGVTVDTFKFILKELKMYVSPPLADSKHITAEEQLAIFLWICRAAAGSRKAASRFHHSHDTIQRINSAPFYCTWIKQPTSENPTDVRIVENPKFTPFFDDCVGALDGTQIRVRVLEGGKKPWRNRYAYLSTNTLAACDFSLRFVYVRAGYKGSGNDQNVFNDAMTDNVIIPKGRFYLADAGYGVHPGLRVPYRGVRYHLKEWGKANTRPRNEQELYNLRHASTPNVQ